ncbi:collagen-like protein [Streptomyces carpaticus]|uniref:Collagen-like protein n=1 Tax=Streptomyces carpaticus TaxID=285558 RepID=A0ABV4ZMJ9_9ACTN
MASSKTRANVARVAAAAIFAAGASLAVVGTANATGAEKSGPTSILDDGLSGIPTAGVDGGEDNGGGDGGDENANGGNGGDEDANGGNGGDEDANGGNGGDEDANGGNGGDEDANGGNGGDEDANGGNGGDEDANGGNGGDEDANGGNGGDEDANGGNGGDEDANGGNGGPGPGVSEGSTGPGPQTEGGTSPIEQNPPTEDITETVPDTTTPAGETPNGDRGELAETGASGGEALLIIGAATMIAGGVAFRYLPRLVNKGAAAA